MGQGERTNPFNQWKKTTQVSSQELYDQYGRTVGLGDIVMLAGHPTTTFKVIRVRPILDPKAPPGLIEATFQTILLDGFPGGQPIAGLTKVRDVLEYMTEDQLKQVTQAEPGDSPVVVP